MKNWSLLYLLKVLKARSGYINQNSFFIFNMNNSKLIKNKTYEEIYGINKAKEIKNKQRIARSKQIITPEQRNKIIVSNTGKKRSLESRQKMRDAQIKLYKAGKVIWCKGLTKETNEILAIRGKKSGESRRGKLLSDETKRKISEANKGDKNYNWKGGSSFEPYGIEFNNKLKEQIRKRDQYRCQECFRHQNELKKKLAVHHIDFNKKNNVPNNLISLCNGCHSQTQYKREDWIDYFQNALKNRGEVIKW